MGNLRQAIRIRSVMELSRRRVCVIGAGTMGGGIAAHLANLGLEVSLLDVTAAAAASGLRRAREAKPANFCVPEYADEVRTAALHDSRGALAEADWVCDAIVENLEAKQALYSDIEPWISPEALVSTNTSGLEISRLVAGRSEAFRARFLGTHFFNPPRYLKLVELIPTPFNSRAVVEEYRRLLEDEVGRRVVVAKDTPGFIANRFGMWAMFQAIFAAEKLGLSVEQVDAITGPFLGRPRSASFRLNDIVGLDIMADIAANLRERCPDDPFAQKLAIPPSMAFLIERGWLGDKSLQGYYRREAKEFLALDLRTHAYRVRVPASFPTLDELATEPLEKRVFEAARRRDEVGEFLREYLRPALQYADWLKEKISHSVFDFDRVMQWGFGWQLGPFGLIDAVGADWVGLEPKPFYIGQQQRAFDGSYVALPREDKFKELTQFPLIDEGEGFRVRDMGDGVLALCLTSKLGVLRPAGVRAMSDWLASARAGRLVLASEAKHFSVGYDLAFFLDCATNHRTMEAAEALAQLQDLRKLLASSASVAAVHGYCLGGGFEIASACTMVAAHPEAQIGLPEVHVGILPCGGGTAAMRMRSQSHAKNIVSMARAIITAKVSGCADDARRIGYLRRDDVTVVNPDALYTEAKRLALAAFPAPTPTWASVAGPLAGMIDQAAQELRRDGKITEHDLKIAEKIRNVMAKSTSLENAEELERLYATDLLGEGLSVARLRHMLEHGKPLRN